MFPDLFSIGPLTIHTYGVFVASAFVVGILAALRIGRTQGVNTQQVMDMGFIIILWGVIGSRIVYVVINFSYYRSHFVEIFKLWQGGLVFSGGLIAVILAMVFYVRRHKLSLWSVGDLWVPAAALGQAVGRIGCLMAGCCYGRPTDMAWGIIFSHPRSLAPLNVHLHPTQMYSSLSGLIIFIILMLLSARKQFEGRVFLWFCILHSTGRLLIERFRGDDRGLIPGSEWSMTQVLAMLILFGAVAGLFILKSRYEKKKPD